MIHWCKSNENCSEFLVDLRILPINFDVQLQLVYTLINSNETYIYSVLLPNRINFICFIVVYIFYEGLRIFVKINKS